LPRGINASGTPAATIAIPRGEWGEEEKARFRNFAKSTELSGIVVQRELTDPGFTGLQDTKQAGE
jgi:hypothetical protein